MSSIDPQESPRGPRAWPCMLPARFQARGRPRIEGYLWQVSHGLVSLVCDLDSLLVGGGRLVVHAPVRKVSIAAVALGASPRAEVGQREGSSELELIPDGKVGPWLHDYCETFELRRRAALVGDDGMRRVATYLEVHGVRAFAVPSELALPGVVGRLRPHLVVVDPSSAGHGTVPELQAAGLNVSLWRRKWGPSPGQTPRPWQLLQEVQLSS